MELPLVEMCENCKFWKEWKVEVTELFAGRGDCRRYPPSAIDSADEEDGVEYFQPDTFKTDWCGEWKPKPSDAGSAGVG